MSLRTWSLAFVVVLFAAASLLPSAASAQASDSARNRSIRVRVAGGFDIGAGDTYLSGGNALGIVGLEWLHRRAPFSARLELSYFADREHRSDGFGVCEDCVFEQRPTRLGLSLDGRYTFFPRSPVKPFVTSGFGIYHTRVTTRTNHVSECSSTGCIPVAGPMRREAYSMPGIGLHSGFGLAVPFRSSELSMELRMRQMTSGSRSPWAIPLLLGIRF